MCKAEQFEKAILVENTKCTKAGRHEREFKSGRQLGEMERGSVEEMYIWSTL